MTEETKPAEKKLYVDEDWKSQVEAEKEAARQEEQAGAQPPGPMPPANLIFLIGTLYLQGAIALGLLPNPTAGDKPCVQLNQAKHAIDLLAVLQEKTAGNRTEEETQELENALHELRMAYISIT